MRRNRIELAHLTRIPKGRWRLDDVFGGPGLHVSHPCNRSYIGSGEDKQQHRRQNLVEERNGGIEGGLRSQGLEAIGDGVNMARGVYLRE